MLSCQPPVDDCWNYDDDDDDDDDDYNHDDFWLLPSQWGPSIVAPGGKPAPAQSGKPGAGSAGWRITWFFNDANLFRHLANNGGTLGDAVSGARLLRHHVVRYLVVIMMMMMVVGVEGLEIQDGFEVGDDGRHFLGM